MSTLILKILDLEGTNLHLHNSEVVFNFLSRDDARVTLGARRYLTTAKRIHTNRNAGA